MLPVLLLHFLLFHIVSYSDQTDEIEELVSQYVNALEEENLDRVKEICNEEIFLKVQTLLEENKINFSMLKFKTLKINDKYAKGKYSTKYTITNNKNMREKTEYYGTLSFIFEEIEGKYIIVGVFFNKNLLGVIIFIIIGGVFYFLKYINKLVIKE